MKNFILETGKAFIDIFCIIEMLTILIVSTIIFCNVNCFTGILTFLGLFIIFIFTNLFLYMFFDCNDNLKRIAELLESNFDNKNTDINENNVVNESQIIDNSKCECPNCKKINSTNNSYCDECGTKLN